MGLIADLLKFDDVIGESTVTDEQIYDAVFDEPEPPIPTREELDAHIQENLNNKPDINFENQAHSDRCEFCQKAQNNTPNPRSVMRYCKYNGVMVSKYQANCEHFANDKKKRESNPWEPN